MEMDKMIELKEAKIDSDSKDDSVELKIDEEITLEDAEKIVAEDEVKEEKLEKNFKIGYFLLGLLLLGIIGGAIFLFGRNVEPVDLVNETIVYNNVTFYKNGQFWESRISVNDKPVDISIYYTPQELDAMDINIKKNEFAKILGSLRKVYISFNPNSENLSQVGIASASLAESLAKVYGVEPKGAVLEEQEGLYADIITCNLTDYPVVEIIEKDQDVSIEYEGNCLRIIGKDGDLVKATNKVLLGWYGIVDSKRVEIEISSDEINAINSTTVLSNDTSVMNAENVPDCEGNESTACKLPVMDVELIE
jgi:predicted RNA-binding protein YlqC (UPF0109 family)